MTQYPEYSMVSIFSRALAEISQPCVHMLLACKVRRWRLFVFSPFLVSLPLSWLFLGPLDLCEKSCELCANKLCQEIEEATTISQFLCLVVQ